MRNLQEGVRWGGAGGGSFDEEGVEKGGVREKEEGGIVRGRRWRF